MAGEVRAKGHGEPPAGELLASLDRGTLAQPDLAAAVAASSREQLARFALELSRSYREKSALLEVTEALGRQLELVPLIQGILERATTLLRADRGSLFLVDHARGELWAKVAQGMGTTEIRFPIDRGISGHVARTGETLSIDDAYQHPLFNPEIDHRTGYRTRSILCAPIRNKRREVIGVLSLINHADGAFGENDVRALNNLGGILALPLENSILYEQLRARQQEVATLLEVGNALSQTLDLTSLIQIIMRKATEIMDADRATLFLVDREKGELWSKLAQGVGTAEIRFPLTQGIAGHVATTGETLNIPDAYQHPLFNREIDQKTGYRTHTILAMPIHDTDGRIVGVTQLINKRAGPFTIDDEALLSAISAQAAVAIDNAQLYERVRSMKGYLENVLQSLSNGVLTIDVHGRVASANAAAARILGLQPGASVDEGDAVGRPAAELLGVVHADLIGHVERVRASGHAYLAYDLDCATLKGRRVSLNVNVVPLRGRQGEHEGVVVVLEDITQEKRVKSSLSRVMSKEVAERMLSGDADMVLGGVRQDVSILFSDIRSYTTLTEGADAHEIVEMLNEYFTYMVDCVFDNGGILDKFIGDAIMAVFGAPFAKPDEDPANAVRAALDMRRQLAAYNEARLRAGKRPIDTGVGISSGEVVCGYIGSEKRMEYTAIGDGVNLASRLEGATKQYGAPIMISEYTRERVGSRFVTRELDNIRVKGKKRPVQIFEVLAEAGTPAAAQASRLLELHETAMDLYRRRHWSEALAAFAAGREAIPSDTAFGLYVDRCRHFLRNPPPADWDGVWELKEK
jgi:adenylate cyclase